MFGIYLMCQFHWELDCVGFCPFEIWRCDCIEMMRGIGGEGFFFSILGYRRGIARVSPEIRELSCLVLSCRCCCCYCCYCCWFCWSCCCCCCSIPSHYIPSCVRHRGHTKQSSLAGRSGWQQPCVLDTLALPGIVWTASVLAPVSLVGRFTLTVVVVKFASHCVFQQNHSK